MNRNSSTRTIDVEVFPTIDPNMSATRFAASMNARRGVPAGTTFGDLIAAARALGVTDSTPLASIEYGVSRYGNGRLTIDRDGAGVVELREGR